MKNTSLFNYIFHCIQTFFKGVLKFMEDDINANLRDIELMLEKRNKSTLSFIKLFVNNTLSKFSWFLLQESKTVKIRITLLLLLCLALDLVIKYTH